MQYLNTNADDNRLMWFMSFMIPFTMLVYVLMVDNVHFDGWSLVFFHQQSPHEILHNNITSTMPLYCLISGGYNLRLFVIDYYTTPEMRKSDQCESLRTFINNSLAKKKKIT